MFKQIKGIGPRSTHCLANTQTDLGLLARLLTDSLTYLLT